MSCTPPSCSCRGLRSRRRRHTAARLVQCMQRRGHRLAAAEGSREHVITSHRTLDDTVPDGTLAPTPARPSEPAPPDEPDPPLVRYAALPPLCSLPQRARQVEYAAARPELWAASMRGPSKASPASRTPPSADSQHRIWPRGSRRGEAPHLHVRHADCGLAEPWGWQADQQSPQVGGIALPVRLAAAAVLEGGRPHREELGPVVQRRPTDAPGGQASTRRSGLVDDSDLDAGSLEFVGRDQAAQAGPDNHHSHHRATIARSSHWTPRKPCAAFAPLNEATTLTNIDLPFPTPRPTVRRGGRD